MDLGILDIVEAQASPISLLELEYEEMESKIRSQVVRIGSRSKSPRIEKLNIHSVYKSTRYSIPENKQDARQANHHNWMTVLDTQEKMAKVTATIRLLHSQLPRLHVFSGSQNKEMELVVLVEALMYQTEQEETLVRQALSAAFGDPAEAHRLLTHSFFWSQLRRHPAYGTIWLSDLAQLAQEGFSRLHSLIALTQSGGNVAQARPFLDLPQRDQPVLAPLAEDSEESTVTPKEPHSDSETMPFPSRQEDAFFDDDGNSERKDFSQEIREANRYLQPDFLRPKSWEEMEAELTMTAGGYQQTRYRNAWTVNSSFKRLHQRLLLQPPLSGEEVENIQPDQVLRLPLLHRWSLYAAWRAAELAFQRQELAETELEYSRAAKVLKETRIMVHAEVMRNAKVVAMTTSGAARYQSVLASVKPPIVIVEEAAEVFEAHLIASLSAGCEHLIMIGDHQQLRPKPAVHVLEKDYHLDISLFERLINNGFPYATLSLQHRMSPRHSGVLMPHFYPNLRDHPSVLEYPEVSGMMKSFFCFNHNAPEASDDSGDKSKKNVVEAEMAVGLAVYLRHQGYKPGQITVLACYVGQALLLKKNMDKHSLLKGVRVAVVDNYQGEESDIIILSMVRSNTDGRIGFLKTPNRVCVSLSRAKWGFFILGNFDFLSAHSQLWAAIRNSAATADAIGNQIQIKCEVHETVRSVKRGGDFQALAPEGGCQELCTYRLDCGHSCVRSCHPDDREHKITKCTKPCARQCPRDLHSCRSICSVDPCPPCMTPFQHQLDCGHIRQAPCGKEKDKLNCREPCPEKRTCGHDCAGLCSHSQPCPPCEVLIEALLPCGHPLQVFCQRKGQDHSAFKCTAAVIKNLPSCGHELKMKCGSELSRVSCQEPCGVSLPGCGHICSGTCGECRRGRLHIRCVQKCSRTLICGHKCEETCGEGHGCGPCKKPCDNSCPHKDCCQGLKKNWKDKTQRLCSVPCPPCSNDCAWNCPHHRCEVDTAAKSGEPMEKRPTKCNEVCERPRCLEPCQNLRKCSKTKGCTFQCRGVCEPTEPCLDICPDCQDKEWNTIWDGVSESLNKPSTLFYRLPDCGHIFPVKDLDRWVDDQMNPPNKAVTPVAVISCPKCKMPIRRSIRYGPVAKRMLSYIEEVKNIEVQSKTKLDARLKELKMVFDKDLTLMETAASRVSRLKDSSVLVPSLHVSNLLLEPLKSINKSMLPFTSARSIQCAIDAIQLLQQLLKVADRVKAGVLSLVPFEEPKVGPVMDSLLLLSAFLPVTGDWREAAQAWVSKELSYLVQAIQKACKTGSERWFKDMKAEITRFDLAHHLVFIYAKGVASSPFIFTSLVPQAQEALEILTGVQPVKGDLAKRLKTLLAEIDQVERSGLRGTGEDVEESGPVKTLPDMSQGHCFKCSNGHVFMVQEEAAECPECAGNVSGMPTDASVTASFSTLNLGH